MATVSTSHDSSHESDEYVSKAKTYVYVWVTLLVFTLIEFLISTNDGLFGGRDIADILILVFTLAKASLVALFFMHLLFEERRKFLIATVFILPLLITIPMVTLDVILPHYF